MEKGSILLLDIGNSTMQLGSYSQGQLGNVRQIDTSPSQAVALKAEMRAYSRVIISSVVPDIDKVFREIPHVCFVTHKNIPSLSVDVHYPQEVGADRLVNALGAYTHYQSGCVIIDSGTALTCCYVDKKGVYKGGLIFPGMGISSKALNDYTAKIPIIHVSPRQGLIGKSTHEAVQIGLYHGFLTLLKGWVQDYRQMDPDCKVVGTGKGLDMYKDQIGLDQYLPDLILKGLIECSKGIK
ncbi:MAG: type III pantothenate kinase [Candidatus Margulisbacteria bacterium]|nr:type III pantothenate kinase [Candidatus Margulisiibacteriota bacterium]